MAEDLTQDTYTSGYNYGGGEFINKNGHTITLIGGGTSADKPGATFNDKVTNQAGATITTINGWANFTTNLENHGKIGTINGDAGFNGLNNFSGTIDSIGGNAIVAALKNGDKSADASKAYIGEISGGVFGDYKYYARGTSKIGNCDVPSNCVQNTGTIKKISGGTFTALANVKGGGMDWTTYEKYSYSGKVDEITGGTFAQVGNEGTIGVISGGKFKDTVIESSSGGSSGGGSGWDGGFNPDEYDWGYDTYGYDDFSSFSYGLDGVSGGMWVDDTEISGNLPAIKNYGTIGEITGTADIESMIVGSGYTGISATSFSDSTAGIGAGRVEKITGGTITKLDIETEVDFLDNTTPVAGKEASVGTISGGKITTLNNGTERYSGGGIIENITGSAQITTLTNRKNSEIQSISGGTIETLENSGTIDRLLGSFAAVTNKGTINNISNGEVAAFTNSGVVSLSEKLVSEKYTNADGSITKGGLLIGFLSHNTFADNALIAGETTIWGRMQGFGSTSESQAKALQAALNFSIPLDGWEAYAKLLNESDLDKFSSKLSEFKSKFTPTSTGYDDFFAFIDEQMKENAKMLETLFGNQSVDIKA